MLKNFTFLFLIYCALPLFLDAIIIETREIQEVLAYINSDTWVFFDIDDTLLTSQTQLGRSDYYFLEFATLKYKGVDEESAHRICRIHWNEMQAKCPVRQMDPVTFAVVSKTQQLAAYTIALTARGPQTNFITHSQFQFIGLDFSISSPPTISVDLPFRHIYESGIWFVEFNEKGSSVRLWLKEISKYPSKIVFIDDRLNHLENMEIALLDLGIEYVGIHYTKILETPFEPQIAQIQADVFPVIITDEEALEKINSLF